MDVRDRSVWHVRNTEALAEHPARMTDCLVTGAQHHPDRVLAARRGPDGAWVKLTYREMLERAHAIGQALLDRGVSTERPPAILPGNDLKHLQLAFGVMWVGMPYAPVSPPYTSASTDSGKLRHVFSVLTPGLVYAADGAIFANAIDAVVPDGVEAITRDGVLPGRSAIVFDTLPQTPVVTADAAQAAIGPDTLVKVLFTSGSTRTPKAVPTTHRMLCSNQQMLRQTTPEFAKEPLVLVDWLPWGHTFGGSYNVDIMLYNGGTLYIGDGRPVPGKFNETLRNLHEIAPTAYFNVLKGWGKLALALERDPALRETFFSRVKLYFSGGAGLSQETWDRLEYVTGQHYGERIRIMAGLGMTETSSCCLFTTVPIMRSGYIGTPAPGCELKLVPVGDKLEARFRRPHVMHGYWRLDEEPAAPVFDEDGYYCNGGVLRFYDPEHPERGFVFGGRIAEDFKLSSGTFVSVGPLRARIIAAGAPYVQDMVIVDMNCDDIGLLVFLQMERCRSLSDLSTSTSVAQVLAASAVRAAFVALLHELNAMTTGNVTRVARLLLLDAPPSLDRGEITDKGALNQHAVLTYHAEHVDTLYRDGDPTVTRAGWFQRSTTPNR